MERRAVRRPWPRANPGVLWFSGSHLADSFRLRCYCVPAVPRESGHRRKHRAKRSSDNSTRRKYRKESK